MPNAQISTTAFDYLKSMAEPLVDTTATVLDRIIEEHKAMKAEPSAASTGEKLKFGGADLPSVTHSSIDDVRVQGKPVAKKDWNHSLAAVISAAIESGISVEKIRSVLLANVIEGQPTVEEEKKGYRYGPDEAGFKFQGLDAERACKNIVALSEQFVIPVEIHFRWSDQAKLGFSGKSATLVLP